MTVETWLAFVFALTLLALSPGPAWAAVVTISLTRGLWAALAMSLGIAVGDIVFVLFAVLGLAALAATLGGFFLLIKIAGAAYLIWLGVNLWRRPISIDPPTIVSSERAAPFWAGLAITLGNPKAIAFYFGFLPAFVDLGALSISDVALISSTAFTVVGCVTALYALLAVRSKGILLSAARQRFVSRLLGTTMIGAGVAVAMR